MDEILNKMWYVPTHGILFSHRKKQNADTGYNMDEPLKHNVK